MEYDKANLIHDDLMARFDVPIQDKIENTFRVGGVYKRMGGGELTAYEVASINNMIMEQHMDEKRRDYDTTDRI